MNWSAPAWLAISLLAGCDAPAGLAEDPLTELDAEPDAAAPDAFADNPDADPDAAPDLGPDAAPDAAPDAELDAGPDAFTGLHILGHRGYAWNRVGNPYPENTLLSVREALRAGADGVEIDVVKTADDVIVLRHDDALATLSPDEGIPRSDCHGRLSQKTWAEVRDCNAQAHSDDGMRTPLDRLEDLLPIPMRMLVLDVKNDGANIDQERALEVILQQVFEADVQDRVVLMLYEPATITAAEAVGVRTCLKRQRRDGLTGEEIAAIISEVGAWASCAEGGMVDAPLMDALHADERGQITFSLGDNPSEGYNRRIRRFLELGVEGAIIDQIEHVRALRDGDQ